MSLDKAIQHGKEKRTQYRGMKRCDPLCRNNGGCPFCEANRTHEKNKKESFFKEELKNDLD